MRFTLEIDEQIIHDRIKKSIGDRLYDRVREDIDNIFLTDTLKSIFIQAIEKKISGVLGPIRFSHFVNDILHNNKEQNNES